MKHWFEWLTTPQDIPALAQWRIYHLTWIALRSQVRIIRLQARIAGAKAEAAHLQAFLSASDKKEQVLVDKSEIRPDNGAITRPDNESPGLTA
jgi:hypothetical protein